MINQVTKERIAVLQQHYLLLARKYPHAIRELALAEVPEMVFHSNAIENSTLTLEDTEDIIIRDQVKRDVSVREVYEAKNLAEVTRLLIDSPHQRLTPELVLSLHRVLLSGISPRWAGRFRSGDEWVRVGTHIGANPQFTNSLVTELIHRYNTEDREILAKIAHFHAEFETIHPFGDGNGRIGRALVNQQLMAADFPPIIIRSKNKHQDYYPLFDEYRHHDKYDGFEELFALALIESLHKRIVTLAGSRVIPLNEWAKQNNTSVNSANNKARRQTIPAFRLRDKWFVSAEFKDDDGVEII